MTDCERIYAVQVRRNWRLIAGTGTADGRIIKTQTLNYAPTNHLPLFSTFCTTFVGAGLADIAAHGRLELSSFAQKRLQTAAGSQEAQNEHKKSNVDVQRAVQDLSNHSLGKWNEPSERTRA